ncbi:3-oxo-5-alpha-steroid 4-dehydrogenase-domain-containing protein [Cristinia sonorae]|uniref:3-oxo-5-alpha-steroid 4-dehydrogenase-domain-containing protein n=1 Tax=Cristinia sonorae TaxID=1940300 RepID=A0A8K0UG32_9AGAR|nr:3-oxo-5-alpha-steroid 4-dehydrogenase-domain-containing protein [Cristinia sonorae]
MKVFHNVMQATGLYEVIRKWFTILVPTAIAPITMFIDAPFGRFTPQSDWQRMFLIDGRVSWILMESVAFPIFGYAFLKSPLSATNFDSAPPLTLSHPPTLLAALYIIHYLNRAIISPLRSPSRSKAHIVVPLSAVGFHMANAFLMGAYLSSPQADTYLHGAFQRPRFWIGLAVWTVGFVGNIVHDEVLLNIRRNAKVKGKAKEEDNNGKDKQEHYAIPHGYLYKYISFPNYFCEWVEWLAFAVAAAPTPAFTSTAALLASIEPPYIFLTSEIFLMMPRAWRGHLWYKKRFPDYPKERKAAIPFLL